MLLREKVILDEMINMMSA